MFFYTILTLLALVHIYIFWSLTRAFGKGLWQIPIALWFLCMLAIWWFRHVGDQSTTLNLIMTGGFFWLGFSVIAAVCLLIMDFFHVFVRLRARLLSAENEQEKADQTLARYRFSRVVPGALIVAACLSIYAVGEAQFIRPYRVTLTTSKLPAGTKSLRLAVISDVHLSRIIGPFMLSRMVNIVNDANADMFLSLGDLVDTDMTGRTKDAELLRSIKTKYGSYGVLGNHDFYRGLDNALRFHEAAGIRLLRGESLEVGGICLVGMDDPMAKNLGLATADPMPALRTCPQNKFVFFLSHRPRTTKRAVGLFDLQASGHLHGGQIWPGSIFFRLFSHEVLEHLSVRKGNDNNIGMLLSTNGAGFWGPPMRFLAPPEVVILDIVAKE